MSKWIPARRNNDSALERLVTKWSSKSTAQSVDHRENGWAVALLGPGDRIRVSRTV